MYEKKELHPDDIIFDAYGPHSEIGEENIKERMQSKDSMWKDKTPGGYEIAKKRLPPLVGQNFCDAIVTCSEIDMRQLSNLVITPEWIYATGQMKEGLRLRRGTATRLRCLR